VTFWKSGAEFTPAEIPALLLDLYPNAALAYSLRKLRSAYTGPVVRVRRSSDNAEADFTASEVSGGSLASWVGAGNDGFVRTWYDQTTNARHAGQATASRQPKVVSSGSLVLNANGKPAMSLSGSNSGLAPTAASVLSGSYSFFSACELDATTVASGHLWSTLIGTGFQYFSFDRANTRTLWYLGAFVNSGGSIFTQALQPLQVWSGVATLGGSVTNYRNGSQLATGTVADWSATTAGLSLFSYNNGQSSSMAGTASEFIWYTASQSNRADIESTMIKDYGIT
jgi:hypothetical protein